MKLFILLGMICTLVMGENASCRRNSGLMKSIKYQLNLVEENNRQQHCTSKQDKRQIGFLATNSKHIENLPAHQVVIFDQALTNDGNAYDPSTGIFTAPVEGLYLFSWTVMTKMNKYFYTYLDFNGKLIALNHAGQDNNSNMSASQTVVLHMKINDKVSIKPDRKGIVMYSHKWSTFSGVLIN